MEVLDNHFSDGEIALVVKGVTDNFRIDGRSCLAVRNIDFRTGVVPSCNGSSQVRSINCNIITGVKAEIGAPESEEPDKGTVEINVDFSANASPKFEGRGGEDLAQDIAFLLSNAIIPAIDRKSLCIAEGHKVWVIYIDVMILECSCVSQLLDLSALAIKAAINDTRLPKLTADENDANDFVLTPDLEEYHPIDAATLPILVTLTRIHDQYVADVTEEEAAAGIARLTMAFNKNGELIYTKKSGVGSLHPDPLKEIVPRARDLAAELNDRLNKQLVIK